VAGAAAGGKPEVAQPAPRSGISQDPLSRPGPGQAILASWPTLPGNGRMQDGEPNLTGTAPPAVATISAATAAGASVRDGELITVATAAGAVTVPVKITQMAGRVVWLPSNSAGCAIRGALGTGHGTLVTLRIPG
jgi:NADH-quinone oxidoreductase subunit G